MAIKKNRLYVGFEFEFLFKGSKPKFRKMIKEKMSDWEIEFRGKNCFQVVDDCSIDEYGFSSGYKGMEFVTPVMSYSTGKQFAKAFLKTMREEKIITSKDCGLHVNLSFVKEELNFLIDPVRLMTAVDENKLLEKWNRQDYNYSQPNQKYLDGIASRSRRTTCTKTIKNKMSKWISENCDHSDAISFEKLEEASEWSGENEPYIEFRIIGGKNYHYHFSKIQATMVQYEKAMYWSVNEFYDRFVTKKINKIRDRKNRRFNWIPH